MCDNGMSCIVFFQKKETVRVFGQFLCVLCVLPKHVLLADAFVFYRREHAFEVLSDRLLREDGAAVHHRHEGLERIFHRRDEGVVFPTTHFANSHVILLPGADRPLHCPLAKHARL